MRTCDLARTKGKNMENRIYTKWNGQYGKTCVRGYYIGEKRGIESFGSDLAEGDESFEESWNKLKNIIDYVYRRA
jgi:pullulanase/glycogen debranching enzyme